MARVGLDRLFAFVAHCHGALDSDGLHVEQVHHPNDARRAAEQLEAAKLSRSFDPDWSDQLQSTSFWLLIYHRPRPESDKRQLIGMIGARVDDIAQGEFAPSLNHRMRRLYAAPGAGASGTGISPPVFNSISGRVASISEFFLTPEFRGTGKINIRALLLLMFAYARTEWDFDWLYALVREDHATHGYLASYCFANTYPATTLWPQGASPQTNKTGIFGTLSRADFNYLVDLVTRRPGLLQFS